jgi:Phage phiEco32-like COOH.NH2 ligase-type 2
MNKNLEKKLTLGADPEFGFMSNRNFRSADEILHHTDDTYSDPFGLDGSGAVAEIRPSPSADPYVVVANIRSAMLGGIKKYPATRKLTWKAGSTISGEPIGGHIHFGTRGLLTGRGPHAGVAYLTSLLDIYLAQIAILLEKPSEATQRRSDYGGLSDYRTQAHGFEYRVLGSWLTDPKVAIGILSLAKVIVYQGIAHRMDTEKLYPDADDFQEANLKAIKKNFKALKREIMKFDLYSKYKEPINFIFELVENNKTWFPKENLKKAWGLNFKTKPLPRKNIKKIWEIHV